MPKMAYVGGLELNTKLADCRSTAQSNNHRGAPANSYCLTLYLTATRSLSIVQTPVGVARVKIDSSEIT